MGILNIRGIDQRTIESIKLSAMARGLTIGQYVDRMNDCIVQLREDGIERLADFDLDARGRKL